ncbi:MAG: hypothetical protein U1A06_10435, partial [Hoeflea sp.]|nr:hypothetical protein [Hoeflea sp.]
EVLQLAEDTLDDGQRMLEEKQFDQALAAFEQIARDGAGFVEVAVHLQQALSAIACCVPAVWAHALRAQSARALERSREALDHPYDLGRVEAAAHLAGKH